MIEEKFEVTCDKCRRILKRTEELTPDDEGSYYDVTETAMPGITWIEKRRNGGKYQVCVKCFRKYLKLEE